MDEKQREEEKPKITRSRARHIRRKRLLSARRAAGEKLSDAELTVDKSENETNHTSAESLSKSKARRLRKKKKTQNCSDAVQNSDNLPDIGKSSHVKDIVKDIEESTTPLAISRSEKKTSLLSDDDNEREDITGEAAATRTKISEHELFENEKNLKITENSRTSPDSHILIDEDYESGVITLSERSNECSELIINEDTLSRVNPDSEIFYESIFVSNVDNNRRELSSIIRDTRILSIDEPIGASNEIALANLTLDSTTVKTSDSKNRDSNERTMNIPEKTRDQVKAEREAKKAAKAAAKSKIKIAKHQTNDDASSMKISADVSTTKSDSESRGDVVDGEIPTMQSKPTIISTNKKKPVILPASVETTTETRSKAELRNERRAKQEAQRAAKQAAVKQVQPTEKPIVANAKAEVKLTTTTATNKIENSPRKIVKRCLTKENTHEVNLFKHLYHEREQSTIRMPIVNSNIHPAIVRLGVQYADKVIVGSNARCVALLAAVKRLIEDFERPSQADFTRGLETCLQESSAYLHHCRPLAVSMQNALKHLKWQMTQLSSTTTDEEAKAKLGNAIDTYIREQIQLADKAISITIQTKISNGDVILTYGYSSLINKILCDAHDAGRKFRVVIVDGRPWLEGREQLRRLAKHGLECSYVLINALSFIMPEVSKVFLGAHAILANGAVMSRVGTAQVALMAKSFNVPVLVACETHKTCERVQTDSIVYNEIADADELAQNSMGGSKKTTLINWRGRKSLNLLNITYDVTPADLVTAVVTELAILPCTSVPVILRIKPSEI